MRHLIRCLPLILTVNFACIAEPELGPEPDAGACVEPPEWVLVELVASRGDSDACPLQGFHLRSPEGANLTERHLAPGCNPDGSSVEGQQCRPYTVGSRFRLPYSRVLMSWCVATNEGWDFDFVND